MITRRKIRQITFSGYEILYDDCFHFKSSSDAAFTTVTASVTGRPSHTLSRFINFYTHYYIFCIERSDLEAYEVAKYIGTDDNVIK